MEEQRSNFDHYVAQHYIKLFTNEEGIAFVGDVTTHSVVPSSDFRRILGRENWSVDQSIEDGFTSIEDRVARVMRTLKDNPSAIGGIATPTALALRSYICMYYARSVGVHDAMNQSTTQMGSELQRVGPPGFDVNKLGLRDATRPESLMMGISVADKIEVALRMKGCVAIMAPDGQQFIIGDNTLANLSSRETFYMRGGLPNRDTYFWFPLNPRLGLLFIAETGNIMGEGAIKIVHATEKLTNTLNRAEVFLATQYIVGATRGLIKGKVRLPNVGDERSKVTALDWAPFIIQENKAVYQISEDVIDIVRRQV